MRCNNTSESELAPSYLTPSSQTYLLTKYLRIISNFSHVRPRIIKLRTCIWMMKRRDTRPRLWATTNYRQCSLGYNRLHWCMFLLFVLSLIPVIVLLELSYKWEYYCLKYLYSRKQSLTVMLQTVFLVSKMPMCMICNWRVYIWSTT